MTSVHGNKTIVLAGLMFLMTITFVLGGILSERIAKIRLYEKKYAKVITSIQEKNKCD